MTRPDAHALARAVGEALVERGWSVGLAESCTGGLVAAALTDIPGSSRYVFGGIIAYADAVKTEVLGVDAEILARHGAVSRETAKAMAAGVARWLEVEVGVSITGIAGPGGGTTAKPVGTVWIAVTSPAGSIEEELRLSGDRREVREGARDHSLALLLGELGGSRFRSQIPENPGGSSG